MKIWEMLETKGVHDDEMFDSSFCCPVQYSAVHRNETGLLIKINTKKAARVLVAQHVFFVMYNTFIASTTI